MLNGHEARLFSHASIASFLLVMTIGIRELTMFTAPLVILTLMTASWATVAAYHYAKCLTLMKQL